MLVRKERRKELFDMSKVSHAHKGMKGSDVVE